MRGGIAASLTLAPATRGHGAEGWGWGGIDAAPPGLGGASSVQAALSFLDEQSY